MTPPSSPSRLKALLVITLAAAAPGALANQAPVSSGDSTVAGQARPSADSPIEVISENLTIRLEAGTAPASDRGLPVRVRAEYHLKNPTAAEQSLALAFPVFNGRGLEPDVPGGQPWFTVAQDGKPLAVKTQTPDVGLAENDEARQRAWVKRLDEWVAARPDVAALAGDLSRYKYQEERSAAYQKLNDVLARHFADTHECNLVQLALEPSNAETHFREVCALLPYLDANYRLVDDQGKTQTNKNGEIIPLLGSDIHVFEGHREEWTEKVDAWLESFADLQEAQAARRATLARVQARDDRQAQCAQLLQTKYGLSAEVGTSIAAVYARRVPGAPLVPETYKVKEGPDPKQEKVYTFVDTVVSCAVAYALWPDVAAEIDAEIKLQSDFATAWGGDDRFVSPLTGKLYLRPPAGWGTGRPRTDPLLAWLTGRDVPARFQPYQGQLLLWSQIPELERYDAKIPAQGESTVVVEYQTSGDYDPILCGGDYVFVPQFTYDLETVKYWKAFGPITVTVSAPAGYHLVVAPELDKTTLVNGRQECTGVVKKVTGNLHVAALPTGDTGEAGMLLGSLPATPDELRALLAATTHKQARPVLRAALVCSLWKMGREYDAWTEARAARAEAPQAPIIDAGIGTGPGRSLSPEVVWNFIERKSKSPALVVGDYMDWENFKTEPAKNELLYFAENGLKDGDRALLADRIAAWNAATGTPEEILGAKFMLCALERDRAKNFPALVAAALAHEECAESALCMIAALPGDIAPAWPLVVKHLSDTSTPQAQRLADLALQVLRESPWRPEDVMALALHTSDDGVLRAAMASLAGMPAVPPPVLAEALGLEERMVKLDGDYMRYLELLARDKDKGIPALRDLMRKRPAWALRIGRILAEQGDMSGIDAAIRMYNAVTPPVSPPGFAPTEAENEMDEAVEILRHAQGPGVLRQIKYRADLPWSVNERLLEGLAEHPDPEVWPLVEAMYNQTLKNRPDLLDGWFYGLLDVLGDKRAVPMLRDAALHGNNAAAEIIGRILYGAPRKP